MYSDGCILTPYLAIMRAKPNRVVVSTEEQALIEFRKRIQAESTP